MQIQYGQKGKARGNLRGNSIRQTPYGPVALTAGTDRNAPPDQTPTDQTLVRAALPCRRGMIVDSLVRCIARYMTNQRDVPNSTHWIPAGICTPGSRL